MSGRACFVHVGTHKTGTTSIQRMLALNRKTLLRDGLHVPTAGTPAGSDGHHNIAWELNGDPRFDAARGTLEGIASEIAAVAAPIVCISSEDFEYLHAKPKRLERLRDALRSAGRAVSIIVYLRPQAEYERSLYAELIKHGIGETAAEFHAIVTADGAFRCREDWVFQFDYDRLTAPFIAAFGADNVIVRHYDSAAPDGALLAGFLAIVRPPEATGIAHLALPERMNRSTFP